MLFPRPLVTVKATPSVLLSYRHLKHLLLFPLYRLMYKVIEGASVIIIFADEQTFLIDVRRKDIVESETVVRVKRVKRRWFRPPFERQMGTINVRHSGRAGSL